MPTFLDLVTVPSMEPMVLEHKLLLFLLLKFVLVLLVLNLTVMSELNNVHLIKSLCVLNLAKIDSLIGLNAIASTALNGENTLLMNFLKMVDLNVPTKLHKFSTKLVLSLMALKNVQILAQLVSTTLIVMTTSLVLLIDALSLFLLLKVTLLTLITVTGLKILSVTIPLSVPMILAIKMLVVSSKLFSSVMISTLVQMISVTLFLDVPTPKLSVLTTMTVISDSVTLLPVVDSNNCSVTQLPTILVSPLIVMPTGP